ncbi:MAG: Gfo/Idh/MocA family protein [Promethearchaeota archaeon]
MNILIYGAGSIGNHLAHACRNKEWNVTIVDIDQDALNRTKNDIYPSRYGKWDTKIELVTPERMNQIDPDLTVIGTPPDTHMEIALNEILRAEPKVMLIEKPLCTPDLNGYQALLTASMNQKTKILTGYNHVLTKNTRDAEKILAAGIIGTPLGISVRWLEHWGGIFSAHPWLNGPADSYLGYSHRGGGACGEHSHGINLFQHFTRILNAGRIVDVRATMDMVESEGTLYDRVSHINVITENELVGSISLDVITKPAVKTLRIQGDRGFMEWYANFDTTHDAVIWQADGGVKEKLLIPKTRPDDFKGEIDEIEAILKGESSGDSISLECGYETMLVIAAAYRSNELKRACRIDYSESGGVEAVQ